ncbi:taud/tfda taurine catabolism dioxygenase [Cucurbitaria berberidis CBS 394.84]|uniref:Taud/tfda taurine catabolism dioxygenase n=1 Tax=Cucurbitaria berberidis CBS 394.84 TaxID=1168544 RepID=A0A9P4GLM5_9PLEO|nr:taud/tfda taurine catabolism dioxygenase [Cucurbitaria berberidis CBS 394.84]KAF1847346.1 taud/tfda taurine catabolism dioxygenase [Cucurbitaria berberidis CBS 394.84]
MATVSTVTAPQGVGAGAGRPSSSQLSVTAFDIPNSRIVHGEKFPLGLELKSKDTVDIDTAIQKIEELSQAGAFKDLLTNHGTILFRGFPLTNATDFQKFVRAFKFKNPHREVGLAGKRTTVTTDIKTANEEPPDVKFYYHSEYGRSAHFPGILFFYSQIVPESGGQTPLLSSLELYDRLKEDLPEFVRHLEERGIIGRQYFPAKEDPEAEHIGWNWRDSYGWDIKDDDTLEVQRAKVEAVLKDQLEADGEWQPNGSLLVLQRLPAIRYIGSTGKPKPTFFNGLAGVYGRGRDNHALEAPHKGDDGKYHLPTTYGDGSPIPTEYLERLLEISDEIGFLVPWQEGDVALINNFTVQHARTPWVGNRSLLVSLWDGDERFVRREQIPA